MASDTVTLALHGERVSLEAFAEAVNRFQRLVSALSAESDAAGVVWEVDALEVSSAVATARGVVNDGAEPESIARVVRSYLEVGQALERGVTVPFSQGVRSEAKSLAEIPRKWAVDAVRFETPEADAVVRGFQAAPVAVESRPPTAAYGAVTGRVQTLTSRNQLRFIVYDHIHDRAVSCYLREGQESVMRQMWDRVATVEGWVTRDPDTGRPLTVRRITGVTPMQEVEPQAYLDARGRLPLSEGDPSPEEAIRRLRDAG
jgi:hypothetical protein